jgi:hemerythrin-like domain-containing protein
METSILEGISATDVLKDEHQIIKDLFRRFDDAMTDRQKKSVGDDCLRQVETHVVMKEELFYPAVRRYVGERQRVVQALAALQVAKLLIKELKSLPGGEHYNARFELLKENIIQHIEEENGEMLPLVEKSNMDLQQLGQQMLVLKDRVTPSRFRNINSQTVAGVAAGAAVIGIVAYLVNRFRDPKLNA